MGALPTYLTCGTRGLPSGHWRGELGVLNSIRLSFEGADIQLSESRFGFGVADILPWCASATYAGSIYFRSPLGFRRFISALSSDVVNHGVGSVSEWLHVILVSGILPWE